MTSIPFVRTVCKAMERIAPLRLAEPWDNVSQIEITSPAESPSQRLKGVNRVLLTIESVPPFLRVSYYRRLQESLDLLAPVIISYHPPIFKGLNFPPPLCAEGISVYSPHTSVDSIWGGINDWLAEGDSVPLVGIKKAPNGEPEGGEGRLVTFPDPLDLTIVISRIKKTLGLSQIQVAYGANNASKTIRTVGICAGSGGSMLAGKDADVYFTGEMSHHEVLACVADGKHVILCGHTNTERGYLPVLAGKNLEGLEVLVSQRDAHPLAFV
ncbi:GTP cyclohydrolase 1 type 2/Nif3 [Mucidula mucida]|nr:GTP cyclohydrolase 1 type 2/Nif3 [Mucidula mucida]